MAASIKPDKIQDLLDNREVFELMFGQNPNGIFIKDLNSVYRQANQAMLDLNQTTREQIVGKTDLALFDAKKAEQLQSADTEVLKGAVDIHEDTKIVDGTVNTYHITKYPLISVDGEIIGLIGNIRDITEHKAVEQALFNSEKRFRTIYEHATIGLYRSTPEGEILLANPALLKMLGVESLEDLRTKNLLTSEFFSDYPREYFEKQIKLTGSVKGLEYQWRRPDGKDVVLRESAIIVYDEDGKPKYYEGTFEDITEQFRSDSVIRALYQISSAINTTRNIDELFSQVHLALGETVDTTNFYIALYDRPDDVIRFPYHQDQADDEFPDEYNPSSKELLTARVIFENKSQLLTKSMMLEMVEKGEYVQHGTLPEIWLGVPLLLNDEVIGAIVVQSYDTPNLYSKEDMRLLEAVSEQVAIAIDRKQSEDRLAIERAHLQGLFQQAPESIVLVDNNGIIQEINPEFINIFGYTEEEVIGKNIDQLLTDEDTEAEAQTITSEVADGKFKSYETTRIRKDGSHVHVSILGAPVMTGEGRLAVYGIYRDITKRKIAETELQEANSMKELLLDVITHDLKNPAGVISGLAELMLDDEPDNELVGIISESTKKLLSVIENATTLSHLSFGEDISKSKLNLTDIVNDVVSEYDRTIKAAGMECNVSIETDLYVNANPIIAEIFKNFLSNAIKYATAGKQIEFTGERDGDTIEILCKDMGETIPEEQRQLIFHRKIQLSQGKKRGRGLGLAIVKRIADAHNAMTGVEPNHPRGNIFFLRIPAN